MRFAIASLTVLLVSVAPVPIMNTDPAYAQGLTMEQIRNNLLSNPPNTGDPGVREETILALDAILRADSSRGAVSVIDFYTSMMKKVAEELREDVPAGAAVWMMYNDGFVVKTPQTVFAFDLKDHYEDSTHIWPRSLPSYLLKQIKVLFVSHWHLDHYDSLVADSVMAYGGYVVVPAEASHMGNVPIAGCDSLTLMGLHVKAYCGCQYNAQVRMYEVTCPDGLRFLHTADNWSSHALPNVGGVDVLLSTSPPPDTLCKCIEKIKPRVVIPGHLQELYHTCCSDGTGNRAPYSWAFETAHRCAAAEMHVMAWGERYLVSAEEPAPALPLSPQIISVCDVPCDRGGQVRMSWLRSPNDAPVTESVITHYTIWRRIDPGLSFPRRDSYTRAFPMPAWDYITSVTAAQASTYHTIVPTLADSRADHEIPWSIFLVRAHTEDPLVHWASPPDSGYSIDNLDPLYRWRFRNLDRWRLRSEPPGCMSTTR